MPVEALLDRVWPRWGPRWRPQLLKVLILVIGQLGLIGDIAGRSQKARRRLPVSLQYVSAPSVPALVCNRWSRRRKNSWFFRKMHRRLLTWVLDADGASIAATPDRAGKPSSR